MQTTPDEVHIRFIQFSLLILFGIPSLACSLYIIYNVIMIRSFRVRFHNKTLIVIVCLILFDLLTNLPIALSYYARGYASIKTVNFCEIWQFLDYSYTATTVWCMAIFSLERYILVFRAHWLRSKRQRIGLHYIPLIIISVYLIAFYVWSIFVFPCTAMPKYNKYLCGDLCIDDRSGIAKFNWLFNILFPVFIIIIGSLSLLIHVLWKRREMQRNLRNWSRNWKLITQLLGIAVVYIIIWVPLGFMSLISTFSSTIEPTNDIEHYLYFASYICEIIIPIVFLIFAPELIKRLRGRIRPSTFDIGSITIRQYSNNG